MDYALVDGDQAVFLPSFGAAIVVVRPGTLRGSGATTLNGRKLCVVGDEAGVSVPGCLYMTPSCPIPGSGTLAIAGLASDQRAQAANTGQVLLLLVGGQFEARFSVQQPALQPTASGSPVPDPVTQYSGFGRFTTTNSKIRVR
jgi:hypothetical protein